MDRVFHVPVRLGAQIHAWRWSRVCRIWTLCQSAFNFHPFDYHNPAPSSCQESKDSSSERGQGGLTKNLKSRCIGNIPRLGSFVRCT